MPQNSVRLAMPYVFRKNTIEAHFWGQNSTVCGIDEVGRGCLAGPLVTAAVILPAHTDNALLRDSKTMTESQRLKAYKWISAHCIYSIGIIHNRIIDTHNIHQATLIAMKKALINTVIQAQWQPGAILVDAMPLVLADTSYAAIPVYHFPKGEEKSSSIAAASIVAKVKRDAIMQLLDTVLPGYHFAAHKGYGTKKHQDALLTRKHSIIHRESFLKNIMSKKEQSDHGRQKSLC